jgi:hypothetical protein
MALLRQRPGREGKPLDERASLERRLEGLAKSPFLKNPVTRPAPAAQPAPTAQPAATARHAPAAKPAPAPQTASAPAPPLTPDKAAAAEASKERARKLIAERVAGLAAKTTDKTQGAAPNKLASGMAKAAKLKRGKRKSSERARPSRFKNDYNRLLLRLNERTLDHLVERLFFVPTKMPMSIANLTVRGPNKPLAHDYRSTPSLVFECALSAVDDDLSRFSFIDYGAGKGRALLLASQHPFRRIMGVEFAEELHDDALMNIAQFPRSRMKCRNVECVLEDATNMQAVEGEAVHYFFDPFEPQIFAEVLARIADSYHAHPRRLYLILVDTDSADMIHKTGIFQKVDLPFFDRLMARLLSPYSISVYRSLA